jgi:transcriptional regulator with XRE-family HTH domain
MNGEVKSLQPEVAGELVRIGREGYEWRRRAGLTQRALEALTGIDQTTICKFERGRLPGLRLHHVARMRLACKTGRRVESSYGRRQPTRPPMSSPTRPPMTAADPPSDDARLITGRGRDWQPDEKRFDSDRSNRGRGHLGQL